VVRLRVEELLDLENAEGDVVKLHLYRHEHDLGKASPTTAAKHVK
jgi:hypothetical protein